jgi:NADH/F420H2 dehydrogenase subunit C
MVIDVTALDLPGDPERFRVVYHLLSLSRRDRLRVRVPLAGDRPSLPTVTGIWPGAGWFEREVFDMFGIRFEGHPDLRRILMPEDWTPHPLRKDYPVRGRPEDDYKAPPATWDVEIYGDWLQSGEPGPAEGPGSFPLLGPEVREKTTPEEP